MLHTLDYSTHIAPHSNIRRLSKDLWTSYYDCLGLKTGSQQVQFILYLGNSYTSLSLSLFSCACSVVANALVCNIVESVLKHWSRYNVHFDTNKIGKIMKRLIHTAMG